MGRYSIVVDIGGTFTDCVVREEEWSGGLGKGIYDPGAIGEGVVQCLKNAAGRVGVPPPDLLERTEVFKIGTTSPVNRLINRAGAKNRFNHHRRS